MLANMPSALKRFKSGLKKVLGKIKRRRDEEDDEGREHFNVPVIVHDAYDPVWGWDLMPRPELGDSLFFQYTNDFPISTAEIAANAPRYRRKSSTFIDGIHDVSDDKNLAPAQLYSTMSGRLFHSGRIAIVMVGLPARGKT